METATETQAANGYAQLLGEEGAGWGEATYSPQDNKLRLYPSAWLDEDVYERVKAARFQWAPNQKLFYASWSPGAFDLLVELCGFVGDEGMSAEDRAAERAERFKGYEANRTRDAEQAHKVAGDIASGIPFGQPILVGHHSEKHARRDAKRIDDNMRKAVNNWDTAKYWKARAASAITHRRYLETPSVRARRIKKIESDRRRLVRTYTPNKPDEILNQAPFSCPVCGECICRDHPEAREKVPHVWCGAGRGGSWTPASRLEGIKEASRRWLAHYDNRLAYEKAMLEDQGASELLDKPKRAKLPPILNYRVPEGIDSENQYRRGELRHYDQYEITKAEYSKVPKDYRGTCKSVDGSHRFKICMGHFVPACMAKSSGDDTARMNRKHSYVAVFLTDSKEHEKPSSEPEVIEADQLREEIKESSAKLDQLDEHSEEFSEEAGNFQRLAAQTAKKPDAPNCDECQHYDRQTPCTLPVCPEAVAPAHQLERIAAMRETLPDEAPEDMAGSIEAMREQLANGGQQVEAVSSPDFYPTPPAIAARMVELVGIENGDRVLEPSAGSGNIVQALMNNGGRTKSLGGLTGYDISPQLVDRLKNEFPLGNFWCADFLEWPATTGNKVHRIVMNPPFSKGQDIAHILHALTFLAPGGRLVALCANGPRQNEKLRPLMDTWEGLPAGSFKASGTGVNVAMMTYQKPSE